MGRTRRVLLILSLILILRKTHSKVLQPKPRSEREEYERVKRKRHHYPASVLDSHARLLLDNHKVLRQSQSLVRQLILLLRIVFANIHWKDFTLVSGLSLALVLRTVLSLKVAQLDGMLVRDLVRGDQVGFSQGLISWFTLAVPSMACNAGLKFLQSALALRIRTRLTNYIHALYLDEHLAFYRFLSLDARVDQLICQDVKVWSDLLCGLYANMTKPVLDLFIFTAQLASSLGGVGLSGLLVNYIITAYTLHALSPSFGRLSAKQARLEGEFRSTYTRLFTNAEEIAFYDGALFENNLLSHAFQQLAKHTDAMSRLRIGYETLEDVIIKYVWSAVGYVLVSIPTFTAESNDQADTGTATQHYISNRRLLLALADAGGRLMFSVKDVNELSGYTSRLFDLIATLHALRIQSDRLSANTEIKDDITYIDAQGLDIVPYYASNTHFPPILKHLDLRIDKKQHTLITGANSTGKTAIMRTLAGLWNAAPGTLERPAHPHTIFVPQRPYFSDGSLRDQVSYPQLSCTSATQDSDFLKILESVHLGYLPQREGGLHVRKDWKDALSGGEKQRLQLARILYHKPAFACLDECTSAVSSDVEDTLYELIKRSGVTLVTVSHRSSLYRHHSNLISLDSKSGWKATSLSHQNIQNHLGMQIKDIKDELLHIDNATRRLETVKQELNWPPAKSLTTSNV